MWKTAYLLGCRFDLCFRGNQCLQIKPGHDIYDAQWYSRHFPALYLSLLQLAR